MKQFLSSLPLELRPIAQDQRDVAEQQWKAPRLAPTNQKPCDHGLFSDDSKQTDLVDMARRLHAKGWRR
jgi:hypothetical protein